MHSLNVKFLYSFLLTVKRVIENVYINSDVLNAFLDNKKKKKIKLIKHGRCGVRTVYELNSSGFHVHTPCIRIIIL